MPLMRRNREPAAGEWQGGELPDGVDWARWVDRWERMQDRYVPHRRARFAMLADLVERSQPAVRRVVDLGCGTGSLCEVMLERFADAEVIGVDLDVRLVALARRRLAGWGARVRLVVGDLCGEGWASGLAGTAQAVVSATSLHWLDGGELAGVYRRVAEVLAPGGIFLNADHVASEVPGVQRAWQERRDAEIAARAADGSDDWAGFWQALNAALGVDGEGFNRRVFGPWRGIEEGLPLSWHAGELAAAGLVAFDCYWRRGGDAIYGAIRPGAE